MTVRALVFVALCVCATLVGGSSKGTNTHLWSDTPFTTQLWQVISSGNVEDMARVLKENPSEVVKARSRDGRGPLWWAYEYGKPEMIQLLLDAGVGADERDADGRMPREVTKVGPTEFAIKEEEEQKKRWEEESAKSSQDDEEEDDN
eukprot:PhF_6_TR10164/c0_g1_i1/m.15777